jgi:GH25 family lysozyme M1 (1,4-beta-N-acetylmuramidase)
VVGGLRFGTGVAVLASFALAAPASAHATSALTGPVLHGLDISAYQHHGTVPINWDRVRHSSMRFAAIKVAEGTYYVNPFYAADARAALRAGLLVAPYTFANPHVSGGASQADYAVRRARYHWTGRMLPLEVDLEPNPYTRLEHVGVCYGLDHRQMVSWIESFAARTRDLTGTRPLIYTTASWWQRCTGNSRALSINPLWVAAYGTPAPQMPAGWPNWTVWQYRSSGQVAGIGDGSGIDLDYGTRSLLHLLRPHPHHTRPRLRRHRERPRRHRERPRRRHHRLR